MNNKQLKIAITGPESTGKSTLATQLADYYKTTWVPEYAREYLAQLGRPYTREDVEQIATGQLSRINKVQVPEPGIIFFDTELIVLKIWMMHSYGSCPDWLLQAIPKQNLDLYLLMNVDLPWEPDPQREHPHLRQFFYDWYKQELQNYGFPFVQISGTYETRFDQARQQVELVRSSLTHPKS